jgi:YVTN family beta-propeller protein
VNISAAGHLTVKFSPYENVTFEEEGLHPGAFWAIGLTSVGNRGEKSSPGGSAQLGSGYPVAIAYDSSQKEIAVANIFSGTLAIVSTATHTLVASVPVGLGLSAVAYDSLRGEFFVTNSLSDNVTVVSAASDQVVASIPVGSNPIAVAYDPGTGQVDVVNQYTFNVSVISDVTNRVVANVWVGSLPSAITYDPGTHQLFVADFDSVSVLSDASDTVVATVPLGTPGFQPGSLAYDPSTGQIFVLSYSGNVTVISDTNDSIVSRIPIPETRVGTYVESLQLNGLGIAYDGRTGQVFVTAQVNFTKTNVTIVSDGNDSVVRTITVPGFLAGAAYDPDDSGVYFANALTQNLTEISDATDTVVGTVALPVGSFPVDVAYDPGTGQVFVTNEFGNDTSVNSMTFHILKGAWKFAVGNSGIGQLRPVSGRFTMPDHAITKLLVFRPYQETVTFRESGLPSGTLWGVNLTGPVNLTVNSTSPAITLHLGFGSYNYTVWNFSGLHPSPAHGSFSLEVRSHTVTVRIRYGTGDPPGAGLPGIEPLPVSSRTVLATERPR